MNNKVITIRPALRQALAENVKSLMFMIATFIMTGMDNLLVSIAGIVLTLLTSFIILLRAWGLSRTSWTITNTQIIEKKGILSKTTNYMELYRIIDYQERQSLTQALLRIRDVIIISGDKSSPVLRMSGVKDNNDLIITIQNKVEKSKERKRIYEFTNQ